MFIRRLLKRITQVGGLASLLLIFNVFGQPHSPRTLIGCEGLPANTTLESYEPTDTAEFVTLRERQFYVGDAPFAARGVNYYPTYFPWRRFLTETSLDTVRAELDILQGAGLNTLRLFLWYAPLFACDGAVPVTETFTLFDNIIHEAAARGFRLIVTLNDLPDLTDYPLYSDPLHNQAQTAFIVQRYREERAILAWDVRNEGDIDYGSNNPLNTRFARDDVLAWLEVTTGRVRELDANHLLTAGWLHDSWSTADYVDFVSFHHWQDELHLRERLAEIRTHTDKPILLEEFGYSTTDMTPEAQAALIHGVIQAAGDEDLLGWLVWAAFDFPLDSTCLPTPCVSADNREHHFGLWYADYTPKPAVAYLSSDY
jgi:hypothetical protein